MSDPDAIPAASLILMRGTADARESRPEILFVQRGRALAFAPGAIAFPGGRIDPEDHAAARAIAAADPEDAAARIAALRETREETGIAIGDDLAAACAMLTPYARWLPPPRAMPRRFDTRFYLAPAEAAHATQADGAETLRAFWARARDMLDAVAAGEATMLFPTRCLVERLACQTDFAAARADALRHRQTLVRPAIERRIDGSRWLTIPDGLGYPYRSERIDPASAEQARAKQAGAAD